MALITCPECSRDISDKAASCPHCGMPMEKQPEIESFKCPQCHEELKHKFGVCQHCLFNLDAYFKLNKVAPPPVVAPADNGGVACPKCKAVNAFSTSNKGFGLGKAAVGGLLLGPVGLLGGLVGSSKTMITCLKCGHKWSPEK